jgi:gluconate 2-dehydrogenase gamma chain
MPHSRRIFLVRTGLAAGGACLLPACFHAPAPFRFFTQAEADCLEALCECIIPGDDAPGAREAGVIYYIDRQLSGFFKKHQSAYRLGIQTLQAWCVEQYGSRFEELDGTVQIDVLERLEAGDAALPEWPEMAAPRFFQLIVGHTMQGFYGPPRHGGNRDYASYRMLGIGYPQVIGRNEFSKS